MILLLTLNIFHTFFILSFAGFEQVNVSWESVDITHALSSTITQLTLKFPNFSLTIHISEACFAESR